MLHKQQTSHDSEVREEGKGGEGRRRGIGQITLLTSGLFYVCAALAHQNDFDVCWCKGSINERIFLPLVDLIKRQGGKIIGGQLVSKVDVDERSGQVTGVHTVDSRSAIERHYEADAVIFAVGITGQ